ncbi:MAG: esterase family protein [Clostridia bacterium]|nr:esterase family protein [Clostridia bacterium]
MALFEMHYYSKALGQHVTLNVILPEISKSHEGVGSPEGEYKTLYLLHGLTDDCNAWLRNTPIERYAKKYKIAVVMPSVARSWYANTPYGVNYFTFVAKELPEVCRSYFKGISAKRKNNFIAGLSMGGYGALKTALTYPEDFAGCASLSGSLDITRKGRPTNIKEWRGNFGFDLPDALALEGSENDIYALARKLIKKNASFPKLFLWCGSDDVIIKFNRDYSQFLTENNIPHVFKESEGDHTWKWWDLHIQDVLEFFFGE